MHGDLVLAGDLGGTKTELAFYRVGAEALVQERSQAFVSAEYAGFDGILTEFLGPYPPRISAACIGVAGPVEAGQAQITNLGWSIAAGELAVVLDVPKTKLLNDLEAMAFGMLRLSEGHWSDLTPEIRPGMGNKVVIAAGTGLGEALLYWDGTRHHPIATEGGHADFAPNDDLEDGLLRFLRLELGGHVSYERILSGPGLWDVYRYLSYSGSEITEDRDGAPTGVPAGLDPAQWVSERGLSGEDARCRDALRLFVRVYGAEAGNLALKFLARGGVLVGGGIAPKILPMLRGGDFISAFRAKGRFQTVLSGFSVRVATHPNPGLLGAAHVAAELLSNPAPNVSPLSCRW